MVNVQKSSDRVLLRLFIIPNAASRFTRNARSGDVATNRHEECGLGGYFSNVFEKDEEM